MRFCFRSSKQLRPCGCSGAESCLRTCALADSSFISFEKKSSLPTPGVLVKGCLDDWAICEPNLEQEIALDLNRKELQNKLLERQIELLDKSQEYRCCPAGSVADTTTPA